MLASTQEHLPIQDIRDDVIVLKDGSASVVLQVSAVNFGLLSENEQLAIISAFAGMLNSLSFMIQILIRSKRLDISTYLKQLDDAQATQTNQLLKSMIGRYRDFIKSTIQENEVLDKQFYLIVPVSFLETGAISKNVNYDFKKILTILLPRRDQIIRQLARVGLVANQLKTEELIKLFYDIYNPLEQPRATELVEPSQQEQQEQPKTQQVQQMEVPAPVDQPKPVAPTPAPQPQIQVQATQQQPQQTSPLQNNFQRRRPYVVEELKEDYGTP